MKETILCYPVATPDCMGDIKAFTGGYEHAFSAIKENGYHGVELLVKNPDEVSREELNHAIEKYDLRIIAIGTSPMQIEDKLFLLHPETANRKEARRRASGLLQLCAEYHASALFGKYRGQVSDAPGCSMRDMREIMQSICDEAARHHTEILLEPQNVASLNHLNTLQEMTDFIDALGYEHLGILADIYHMEFTEESIAQSIKAAGNKIGFFHLSDSKRKIPGQGALDFSQIFEAIRRSGCVRKLSFEVDQKPDSETVVQLCAQFIKNTAFGR
mgnify:FL=1